MKIFYFIELPGNCAPLRLSMQKCYNSFELRYIIEESATERHFVSMCLGLFAWRFSIKYFPNLKPRSQRDCARNVNMRLILAKHESHYKLSNNWYMHWLSKHMWEMLILLLSIRWWSIRFLVLHWNWMIRDKNDFIHFSKILAKGGFIHR